MDRSNKKLKSVRTPYGSLHRKLTLDDKSLAAPGNRTCLSGVQVRRSSNWATSPSPCFIRSLPSCMWLKRRVHRALPRSTRGWRCVSTALNLDQLSTVLWSGIFAASLSVLTSISPAIPWKLVICITLRGKNGGKIKIKRYKFQISSVLSFLSFKAHFVMLVTVLYVKKILFASSTPPLTQM